MKAFVITRYNGQTYDCREEWTENIYLVPDDFSENKAYNDCVKALLFNGKIELSQHGAVLPKYRNQVERYFLDWVDENYKKLPIINWSCEESKKGVK